MNSAYKNLAVELGRKLENGGFWYPPVPRTLERDTTFEEMGLDSLDHVEVVMMVEDDYHLVIEDDEAERLSTFGNLVDLVAKQTKVPLEEGFFEVSPLQAASQVVLQDLHQSVTLSLNPAEYRALQAEASNQGVSISEAVNSILKKALK